MAMTASHYLNLFQTRSFNSGCSHSLEASSKSSQLKVQLISCNRTVSKNDSVTASFWKYNEKDFSVRRCQASFVCKKGSSGTSRHRKKIYPRKHTHRLAASAEQVATGGNDGGNAGTSDKGRGGDGEGEGGDDSSKNKAEAMVALAALGQTLESLPADLARAIADGKIPAAVVERFFAMQKSPFFRYLMNFGGFKERLLADDLFLTKVAIECGVGIFTKTAAELERRRENFTKELDFVFADIAMALLADFMLVWLPAPTVGLRGPVSQSANMVVKFLASCPDNAFQIAMRGTTYTLPQRVGAIVRNGAKLFVVGTGASLVGTGATNAIIGIRKVLDSTYIGGVETTHVPILETSLAYGAYMAVSSNLRYQVLAGVIEQRMLEPFLHDKKLALSVLSFVVRTGNTFLGSLMWVDYARWIGIQ